MNNYNSPFNQVKTFFNQNNIIVKLIKINIAVWLVINAFNIYLYLYGDKGNNILVTWLAVPASIDSLITRPWTLFTYMFLHEEIMHLFMNMLMLYFGGVLFMQFLDARKLLNTYIFGGLTGSLFYVIAFNIFPIFHNVIPFSVALGASASVLAIIVAAATYAPEFSVPLILIGNVKLKYIAIVFVLLDLTSIKGANPGGHIAHLGGAFYGFMMAYNLRHSLFKVPTINLNKIFSRKPKMKYTKTEQPKRPLSDDEYNRIKAEKQKVIDAILDKISKKGYDSLSKEEKEILFKSSNKG